MTDLVPRPARGRVFEGRAAGAAGRREPGGPAAPRRRRPVPAGPLGRRHRRRRPARRRGLGGAQDGHRGGGLPPLPRAAGAGHVVLGHRQPLGRAPHLDRGRAGRRASRPPPPGCTSTLDVGPPEPDPGRASTTLYGEAHRRPPGEGPPRPPRPARRRRSTASPWPLRFTDFDVLGHVNNAACWQIVEEALAARRDLRAPLRAEVQHRTAIERGATVEVHGGRRRRTRWRCGSRPTATSRCRPWSRRVAARRRVAELLDRARSAGCRARRGW